MTSKEAIVILEGLPDRIVSMLIPLDIDFDYKEAIDLAVKALKREAQWEEDNAFREKKWGKQNDQ